MLSTFSSVTPFLKFNPKRVTIDNFVFKLHYRWTFIILLVCTILVCSRQYIGEHIKCISETIPANVINTFCFFTPTFTLVRHLNSSALAAGSIFEPGIGPYESQEEPIRRHAYYQWVQFVLFGQAICFYIPHLLWKSWEGGRIRQLVVGLRMVGLTQYVKDKRSKEIGSLGVPTMEETDQRVKDIRRTMIDNMRLNQSWGAHLVCAEFLNLFNLILQIIWTNQFLDGAFYALGIKVIQQDWTEEMNYLDVVFPKVTKCHFFKYGASGSLQMHDTLCVMALNIINEKIYTMLWFWYLFVLIASLLGVILRIITLFCYKSKLLSKYALFWAKPGKVDEKELVAVVEKCNFSNWMFLYFLRSNVSEFIFKKIVFHLSSEFPDAARDNMMNARLDEEQEASTSRMQTWRVDDVDTPLLKEKEAAKIE